jgi:ABC-type glycerol-3-phosphate transport system substrate-binding protein
VSVARGDRSTIVKERAMKIRRLARLAVAALGAAGAMAAATAAFAQSVVVYSAVSPKVMAAFVEEFQICPTWV